MPIYYGCPNLADYFPKEAYIEIDIEKPDEALSIILEAVANKRWKKNIDAIVHARELLLEEYQFFPFLSNYIKKNKSNGPKELYSVKALHWPANTIKQSFVRRILNKFM
ncbi:hypothetical protein [Cesiribacter andamanensis]|uniref:hypothetical protein n=1 Tax=Cesiribacter andamanensis TaxID=649507 RepID=UPI00058AD7D0|nr:hypothetical protein [Cesiribacter andamanensis]